MQLGSIDLGIDKVVMFGIAGSGKTCSLAALLGMPPPEIRCSTPLLERPIEVKVISVDDKLQWQKMTREQVRKRIAEIIKSRAESPSILAQTSPNSGHTSQQHPTASASHPHLPTERDTSEAAATPSQSDEGKMSSTTELDFLLKSLSEVEEEFVSLINNSTSSSKPILKQNWLYVIDSGGQHEFHEVLPIFLNGAANFIFVFKVHESLDKRPEIAYYDSSGKLVGVPYHSFLTNKEIFKQCMCTMHSFASRNKDTNPPQVLILGTHRDMVKEEDLPKVLESINKSLKEVMLPHFRDQIIFCDETLKSFVFTINAQQPEAKDKECAEALRAFLGKQHGRRRVKMPLRWHALEDRLQQMAEALKQKVLSHHECKKIAQSLHIDDESCEEALNFFNDLNMLFYYPTILPGLVFLEPQVILDKLSELVKASHRMRQESQCISPTSGEWRKFRDYAKVTEKFLEEFDTHYEAPLFTPKELIMLFKHLLVFAELSTDTWFMPSLLEVVSEGVAQYRVSGERALVIHFPEGGPQSGMFCCLIAFILSTENADPVRWKVFEESQKPRCLTRNVVMFSVGELPGSVTIIDYFTHFEVHVHTHSQKEFHLWNVVQSSIFRGLSKASKILGYSDNTPQHAIVCPAHLHVSTPHPATIDDEGVWTCSESKQSFGVVVQGSIPWLRISTTGKINSCTPILCHPVK